MPAKASIVLWYWYHWRNVTIHWVQSSAGGIQLAIGFGIPYTIEVLRNRESERASRPLIPCHPYVSVVSLDNRAADGQPDTHAVAFCTEESFEKPLCSLRLESNPCILNTEAHFVALVAFGSDN
jgi:hypothetical protein